MPRSIALTPSRDAFPFRAPLRPRFPSPWRALFLLVLMATTAAAAEAPAVRGMPFTRRYSLEDVGYGPRGARLDFDRFGRVAVIHDGVYSVLNDTVWSNIASSNATGATMSNVVAAADGRMYYGSRASWGRVDTKSDGLLHPIPLVPPDPPAWVRSASFSDVIDTAEGVYFISPNGIAFWNFQSEETQFYESSRIARAFRIGSRVYVSCFSQNLRYIDVSGRELKPAPPTDLDRVVVELATPLDDHRVLLSLLDGRLVVFDGQELTAWAPPVAPWGLHLRDGFGGRVSVLHHLVDGRTAIAVTGKGLFLYSDDDELLLALTSPEYHRITALANREPGVLWVATEDGIEKILYRSALTSFGQRLGLTLGWPIIERWQGRVLVASDGKLYRARPGLEGAPTQFELHPFQPDSGAWALASSGTHLLVAGPNHVYAMQADGSLQEVAAIQDMAHLVMTDSEHCYAIGRSEIALLKWQDGRWIEPFGRTHGVTYPSVAHRVGDVVWIEMAGQVGRLWRNAEQLQLDVIPNSSWTTRPWVNIGSVDGIAVLSAETGERRFFDEQRGAWTEDLPLQQLLNQSPFWIARVEKDESGTIWATHDGGVVRFTPTQGSYEIDTTTFDLINDRYPVLQVLPGNDIWIIASQSLYHVQPRWASAPPRTSSPVLVSLIDAAGSELLSSGRSTAEPFRLPFDRNSLTFRFFSGTEADRRAPTYEYKLAEGDPWTVMAGSQVSFRGLHEGKYTLNVRRQDRHRSSAPAATVAFVILPPWYRTWPAYTVFGLVAIGLLVGMVRWSSYVERRRNRALERIVHERTRQLEETMARLGEETRNAATLAERDRLANEIHDSVQQGLTGAILQLDTTLKHPAVGDNLRSRLNVVRNMVSYARQEVQHAVWDMESPLLEGSDLAEALRNLTAFVDSSGVSIDVFVSGSPVPLSRTINHNLLRIAQEATTNALRHAKPQHVSIRLEYQPDAIALSISDDGIGFAPPEVLQSRTGHLGLRGIQNRVKKLQGRLTIDSVPHQGTSIRIAVPYPLYEDSSEYTERNLHA